MVTWGDPVCGGISRLVQDRLVNVQQIYSTDYAFAAVTKDGDVVTGGDEFGGGNSGSVQDQLVNVQRIYTTGEAFAALTNTGDVVTWGNENAGGKLPTRKKRKLCQR